MWWSGAGSNCRPSAFQDGVHPVGQRQHTRGIPAPLIPGQAAARNELIALPHGSSLASHAPSSGYSKPGRRCLSQHSQRRPGSIRTASIAAGPVSIVRGSAAGSQANAWDHFGTTRYASGRTTCTSAHPVPGRHSPTDQSKRLTPLPGGQGVAGSNPAVPTGSDIFRISFHPARANKRAIRCEMALLAARADHVPRPPTRAFVNMAEPAKPAASKIAQPPPDQHTDPDNCEPADTIPGAPAHRKPDAHRP